MKIPAFIECRDFFIVGQFLTKLKGNEKRFSPQGRNLKWVR
jgi:hypothetical protein